VHFELLSLGHTLFPCSLSKIRYLCGMVRGVHGRLCEVCHEKNSKYRCVKCAINFCSVGCSNVHKEKPCGQQSNTHEGLSPAKLYRDEIRSKTDSLYVSTSLCSIKLRITPSFKPLTSTDRTGNLCLFKSAPVLSDSAWDSDLEEDPHSMKSQSSSVTSKQSPDRKQPNHPDEYHLRSLGKSH